MVEQTMPSESTSQEPNTTTSHSSNEATIDSNTQAGTESTCNDNNASQDDKSLDFSQELTRKGVTALNEDDFAEAVDCFSRALEIKVTHYGELAPECVNEYYQYGRALLYKAQEEADPLGAVPKKESEGSIQNSEKDGSVKSAVNGESSIASASSNAAEDLSSVHPAPADDDASDKKEQEDDAESDDEELAEADEDDSDLDLAWKMLDVARAIAEKSPDDAMDKVDILSALAEVALEREDIETSLSDYLKALSILERLVEPDSRRIAELNFRICLCLEIGSKPQEAIPYCKKAISVCKSRVQRLKSEVNGSAESSISSVVLGSDETIQQSSNGSQIDKSLKDREAEIETLSGLSGDLEKKLEDLQQLVVNPKSILSEILGMASAKLKSGEKSTSSIAMSSSQMATATTMGGFDSPTVSTAHSNGPDKVTHLGVVGRGVKRVLTNASSSESSPTKKTEMDPSGKGSGNSS